MEQNNDSRQAKSNRIQSKCTSTQPTTNGRQPANDSKQLKCKINQPKPR